MLNTNFDIGGTHKFTNLHLKNFFPTNTHSLSGFDFNLIHTMVKISCEYYFSEHVCGLILSGYFFYSN